MSNLEDLLKGAELRPNKGDNHNEPQRELTYKESHRASILKELKDMSFDVNEVLKTFDNDINNIPLKADGHINAKAIERCLELESELGVSEPSGFGRDGL